MRQRRPERREAEGAWRGSGGSNAHEADGS
jgi:hypothetical protein